MARPPFRVPHHFQRQDHTCGPAALKMVFDSLWGVQLSERELAEWVAADKTIGTRQRYLEGLLRRFGLDARSHHTKTTVDDLRDLLIRGHVILVLYRLETENTDHYAVVKRVTREEVVLHDPWLGPDVRMPIDTFEDLWVARDPDPGRKDRWALAVRDARLLPEAFRPTPTSAA